MGPIVCVCVCVCVCMRMCVCVCVRAATCSDFSEIVGFLIACPTNRPILFPKRDNRLFYFERFLVQLAINSALPGRVWPVCIIEMAVVRVLESLKCVLGPQQQAIFLKNFIAGPCLLNPRRGTPPDPRQIFIPPSVAALVCVCVCVRACVRVFTCVYVFVLQSISVHVSTRM